MALKNITELGNNLAITVSDAIVSAAEINDLSLKTTNPINVDPGTIYGSATDLIAAYTAAIPLSLIHI